jgi:hypothetical protein
MGIDLKVKHADGLMFVCMVTAKQLMSTGFLPYHVLGPCT